MKKQMLHEQKDHMPYEVQLIQEWFAGIITGRLGKNDTILPHTPSGGLIAEEAARYIVPSPTLRPHQRMQIYNQQYWWRLLNALHTNFPFTTRLFGIHAFNEKIAVPYLLKYPPDHWCLSLLGEHLPKWIEDSYHEADRLLIDHAVCLDCAYMMSFIAPQSPLLDLPQLTQESPERLLEYTLYLQPHVHLFAWEYDLMTFRGCFLKQPVDYWMEHRFPELSKGRSYRFILYRNARNNVAWREIGQGEWLFLESFKRGSSLVQACEYLEKEAPFLCQEADDHFQQWLQEWTQAGWLTLTPPKENHKA